MKKPKYIVIHHTAVSYSRNADQWEATNNYHKDEWGVKSSLGYYGGYNYEISKEGSIKQFRKDGERTVAQYQKNMNDGRAISICLDGYFDIEDPSDAQKQACKRLLEEKMDEYGIKPKNVLKHRDLAKYKTCPGSHIPDDIYKYFVPKEEGINNISVKLYRDSPNDGARFYVLGKHDGLWHHITDEGLFKTLFGGFNVEAEVGPPLPSNKKGFTINSKF